MGVLFIYFNILSKTYYSSSSNSFTKAGTKPASIIWLIGGFLSFDKPLRAAWVALNTTVWSTDCNPSIISGRDNLADGTWKDIFVYYKVYGEKWIKILDFDLEAVTMLGHHHP